MGSATSNVGYPHFWEIDLNETSQNAKAISLNNTVLINLTEPVT